MERELVQVEQARAVAAMQQEAHRIASRLDDNVTTQQSEQAAQAAAAEQVRDVALTDLLFEIFDYERFPMSCRACH